VIRTGPLAALGFLAGAFLLLSSCARGGTGQDEEYRIYDAFFSSRFAEKVDPLMLYERAGIFFIYGPDHYFDQGSAAYIDNFLRTRGKTVLDFGMIESFVERNRTPAGLDAARLERKPELLPVFRKKDVYIVSRAGFDPGARRALLYVSFSSNAEFGHGNFIVLRKSVFGTWRAVKSIAVWIYD
jgi:hypothetical protein